VAAFAHTSSHCPSQHSSQRSPPPWAKAMNRHRRRLHRRYTTSQCGQQPVSICHHV
jgi:hypothetical protein